MSTTLPSVRLYGLQLRPCLPPQSATGDARIVYPPSPTPEANAWCTRHGTIEYDRALPDDVIAHFDLVPLFPSREAAASALLELASGMLGYAQRYEDSKRGGEGAAISAASVLSERVQFRVTGQYAPAELATELRAAMLARGMFEGK